MSKVLKIRVGRSGKKKEKKAEVPIIGYQISLFVTEMLPVPWQEVQICVHDVHETHFPLYYSSACSYRKLCRFEKMLNSQAPTKTNYSDFFYSFHSKCSSQKKKKLLWTGLVGK